MTTPSHAVPYTTSKNDFGRAFTVFLWKELYNLAPLILALTGLGVLLQLIGVSMRMLPGAAGRLGPGYFQGMAVTVSNLFAIAAAGTRFAMEREDGTHQWLVALPLSLWTVFLSKLVAVVLAAALILAILLGIAQVCIGSLDSQTASVGAATALQIGRRSLPILLNCIAWSIVFSLMLPRALVAVLVTVAFLSLVQMQSNALAPFFSPDIRDATVRAPLMEGYWFSAAAGLALSIFLAGNWLNRATAGTSANVSELHRLLTAMFSRRDTRTLATPSRYRAFAVLLWQSMRESSPYLLAAAIAALLLSVLMVLFGRTASQVYSLDLFYLPHQWDDLPRRPVQLLMWHCYTTTAVAVYASAVFAADHAQSKYRILGALPAPPTTVWWSRQMVAGIPVLALIAFIVAYPPRALNGSNLEFLRYQLQSPEGTRWLLNSVWSYLGGRDMASAILVSLCGGYAVGQLTSLVCRSSVIAGAIAVLAAIPLWLWGSMLSTWQLPLLVFYLPIPIVLMIVSLWRMGLLLQERSSWQRWAITAVAVTAPLLFAALIVSGLKYRTEGNVRPMPIGVPFFEQLGGVSRSDASIIHSGRTPFEPDIDPVGRDILLARTVRLPQSVGDFVVMDVKEFLADGTSMPSIDLDELARESSSDRDEPADTNLAIQVGRELRMPPPGVLWSQPDNLQLSRIVNGLERRAGEWTQDGNLTEAFEYLRAAMRWRVFHRRGSIWLENNFELRRSLYGWMVWASHPDQAPEQLTMAREELNQLLPTTGKEWLDSLRREPHFFPAAPAPLDALYAIRQQLLHPLELPNSQPPHIQLPPFSIWLHFFPGETFRSLQLLDRYASVDIYELGRLNDASLKMLTFGNAKGGGRFIPTVEQLLRSNSSRGLMTIRFYDEGIVQPIVNPSFQPRWTELVTTPILMPVVENLWRENQHGFVANQTLIRGSKLQLDLIAFHREHGRWPTDLAELAEGSPFEMPLQPLTNTPFEYWPDQWKWDGNVNQFDLAISGQFTSSSWPAGWQRFYPRVDGPGFRSHSFDGEPGEASAVWLIRSYLFPLEWTNPPVSNELGEGPNRQ